MFHNRFVNVGLPFKMFYLRLTIYHIIDISQWILLKNSKGHTEKLDYDNFLPKLVPGVSYRIVSIFQKFGSAGTRPTTSLAFFKSYF